MPFGRCLDCRPVRAALAIPALALALAVAAGCGGDDEGTTVAPAKGQARSSGVQKTVEFPEAGGRSLDEVREGMQQGLVLAPSVSVLHPGVNRYAFALFDAARKQVAGAPAAIYVSRNDGTGVRGPYTARSESLAVEPQYRSRTSSGDPDAAESVYVADVKFPKTGRYRVTAVTELDGRRVSTSSFTAEVRATDAEGLPPAVGDAAPSVNTPTLDDVAGDAARLTTRVPPAKALIAANLRDVLGDKPVVLLFATPALCQSRVCAPVVDVTEQVRSERDDDDVAFIASEIYRENRVEQGLRPAPAAFRLPTEPWLFVLDRAGRVAERIEGAFSARELEAAIRRAERAR